MARYEKVLPLVDSQANTFPQIHSLMTGKGYKYEVLDGESVFRKGDGVWVVARYLKISYAPDAVRVQAWINNTGMEMGLDGFYGSAVKKKLRKLVEQVEAILSEPAVDFVPAAVERSNFCMVCGSKLEFDGTCPRCALSAKAAALPQDITLQEYLKNYAGDVFAKGVKAAAILGYICVGINAVISVLLAPIGIIESLIFLALTLGMHLGKNKLCAIGMMAYAVFTVLMGLVLYGTFGGWLWLIAGITALLTFVNAEKRYKELTGK